MGGHDHHHESYYKEYFFNENQNTEDYFVNELSKDSLKEPPMKYKIFWNKPLSLFHKLEFRGIDARDRYKATKKDEWDMQVYNVPTKFRGPCRDYIVDYLACSTSVYTKVLFLNKGVEDATKYCWKPRVNYDACMVDFGDEYPEYFAKNSKVAKHH